MPRYWRDLVTNLPVDSVPSVEPTATAPAKSMNLWSVAALGIGSMVGAGIFALLGQAALAAGNKVYIAFLIGGVIALLSGYSYARLGARYPGSGGVILFFNQAFPSHVAAGAMSLLYLITLTITVAMVARAFGAYASRLFLGDDAPGLAVSLLASAIVIALTLLNVVAAGLVGRAEVVLVGIKLSILVLLLIAGLKTLDPDMLTAGRSVGILELLGSVGLTFFAYAGYGIMANAAGSVAAPERTIPRAIFLAIGTVIVLYIGLALVVLGNVSAEDLALFADTAVAQAAEPVLGRAGFVLVSIAALLATASAINATLFSAINISRGLVSLGQLPETFAHPILRQGTIGLLGIVAIILILANLLNLGAIATIASATFLITYLAVFVAHWRLRPEAGGNPLLILLGLAMMGVIFVAFLISVIQTQPAALVLLALVLVASLIAEWMTQHRAGQPRPLAPGAPQPK